MTVWNVFNYRHEGNPCASVMRPCYYWRKERIFFIIIITICRIFYLLCIVCQAASANMTQTVDRLMAHAVEEKQHHWIWQPWKATSRNTHASKCGKSEDCSGWIEHAQSTPTTGLDKEQLPFCSAEWQKFLENMCGMWNCVVRLEKTSHKNTIATQDTDCRTLLRIMWIYKSPRRKRNKAVAYFIEHGSLGDWKTPFFGSALEIQICLLLFCEVKDKYSNNNKTWPGFHCW